MSRRTDELPRDPLTGSKVPPAHEEAPEEDADKREADEKKEAQG